MAVKLSLVLMTWEKKKPCFCQVAPAASPPDKKKKNYVTNLYLLVRQDLIQQAFSLTSLPLAFFKMYLFFFNVVRDFVSRSTAVTLGVTHCPIHIASSWRFISSG